LEFDVTVGAGTFQAALSKFILALCDFAVYLGELDDLAENEEQMFHLLAPRMIRVTQEFERFCESKEETAGGKKLARKRRLREDRHEWRRLSLQPELRQPSPV
jgi:hypothetical protein